MNIESALVNSALSQRWLPSSAFALFFVTVGVLLSWCVFLFWLKAYPNADDPKNIDYELWKHGLNGNMNLDAALRAMTHDHWPVQRVAGLSKKQLQERFGYIRSFDETTPCGHPKDEVERLGGHPGADEVVTLRDSNWMVLLKDGIAVDLRICKG
jgi:hypothetical protein